METGLFFQNLTSQTIWLGLLYYDEKMGFWNQYFRKTGWWSIGPRTDPVDSSQFVQVMNQDLRTVLSVLYFEAEFAADISVWPPPDQGPVSTMITDAAYDEGYEDQTACNRWVHWQRVDLPRTSERADAPPRFQSMTVQLGPEPGQFNVVETVVGGGILPAH